MPDARQPARTVGKALGFLLIWAGVGTLVVPGHPLSATAGFSMIAIGAALYLWLRSSPNASGEAIVRWASTVILLCFLALALAALLINLVRP